VKLALISLSKDDPEGGGPIGLLPLFDSMLVDRQVKIATRLGAERIVFLCPTIPGAILQYIDQLKQRDIDAEIVRTARELVQYSSEDNELLVIGDGILLSPEIENRLLGQSGEVIYVVDNDDVFEDFERIDLNQRWVGLAQLKASRLSLMIDVPDDWNVGSALLRIAVQSECRRDKITNPEMVAGAIMHLENSSEAAEYTNRKLKQSDIAKGGLLEKFALWPITRRLLPKLWKWENSRLYLKAGGLLITAIAVIVAYFEYSVVSLSFLLIAVILGIIDRDMDVFSDVSRWYYSYVPKRINILSSLSDILLKVTLALLVTNFSEASQLVPNLVILVTLWLVELARQVIPEPGKFGMVQSGELLQIMVLLILTPFGYFLAGIYAITLWSVGYLVYAAVSVAKDLKNREISAK